jgi:hypothetical protein
VSARKTRKIRCHWNGGPIFETKRQEATNAPTTVIEPLGARNVMSETIDDAFAQMGTGGLEPFDEEYGVHDYTGKKDPSPYPRVNRIRRRVFDAAREVEEHRALLVTEAYKAYEADTAMLKCAKAVAHLYRNIPLHIWPEELIVGVLQSIRSTPMNGSPTKSAATASRTAPRIATTPRKPPSSTCWRSRTSGGAGLSLTRSSSS